VLIARVAGGAVVRLLAGVLAAALALVGCTVERTAVALGPPFLRVVGVGRASEMAAVSPPAWAPRGAALAFGTADAVWEIQADGTAARRLVSLRHATQVAWAPDARSLAAVAEGVVYVFGLEGTAPVAVTEAGGGVRFVAWAPQGERLAYAAAGVSHDAIGTWNAGDRAGRARGAGGARGARGAPMGLPDGLAVRTLDWLADGGDLFVAVAPRGDAPSSRLLRVRMTRPRPTTVLLPLRGAMAEPTPDPRGRWVAYVAAPSPDGLGSGHDRVVVARLDGTGGRPLTSEGTYTGLAWAPSGTVLAYGAVAGPDEVAVEIVDVTTGARLRITDYRPEVAEDARVLAIRWAPDGLRLAFGTDTGDGVGPVWVATLERR